MCRTFFLRGTFFLFCSNRYFQTYPAMFFSKNDQILSLSYWQ